MLRRVERIGGRTVARTGRPTPTKRAHKSEQERRAHEPWREGYDAQYRRDRQAALDRTHGRCARCGKQIAHRVDGAWRMSGGEVHHTTPLAEGGRGCALVPLCISCHRRADYELRARRNAR